MPFTRRTLLARAAQASGAAVVASALPGTAGLARAGAPAIEVAPWPALQLPDPPLRAADYLRVADEAVRRLDRTWVPEERAYRPCRPRWLSRFRSASDPSYMPIAW